MADLLAIKNYVMLFINDQADFMAEQANHTTYSWNIKWQKCAHMAGSETSVVDGSDYG